MLNKDTLNGKPVGRWQKRELFAIIVQQEDLIRQQKQLFNMAINAIKINKKNAEYFKRIIRDIPQEIEELEDK